MWQDQNVHTIQLENFIALFHNSKKKSKQVWGVGEGGCGHEISRSIDERAYAVWKLQGSVNKEAEFAGVF